MRSCHTFTHSVRYLRIFCLLLLAGGLISIVLITVLLLFVYVKNKQLNKQRIQVLKKEQEAQTLKAVIAGEEKERKRVARELHEVFYGDTKYH